MPLIHPSDLDYRPQSYWDPPDVAIANIVGDIRKACVIDAVAAGQVETLPPEYFAERITPDQLAEFIRNGGPACRGGEQLPRYLYGETEIARLAVHPAVRMVVTIRARQEGGRIRYRLVADPAGPLEWNEPESALPLSLKALAKVIQTIRVKGERRPLLTYWWWCSVEETSAAPHAIEQVKAISVFYPKLSRWYQQVALQWAADTLKTSPQFGGELVDAEDPRIPDLHRAVLTGDAAKVCELLSGGHAVDRRLPASVARRRHRGGFAVNAGLRDRLYRLLGKRPVVLTPMATPLHLAAANGQRAIVDLLLDAGGDPELPDADGNTAIDLAELNWDVELAARLESHTQTSSH